MARRITGCHRKKLVTVMMTAALAVCAVLATRPSAPAKAAPHVISTPEHPFDPDWPLVKTMLLNKCIGCHRAGMDRADLTSYDAIMAAVAEDGRRVVQPGRPDDSALWECVVWNAAAIKNSPYPSSPMMPDDKAQWLTAGQLQVVERWIRNGALQYKLPTSCNIRPLLESDFPSARQCQACHPKQYDEWSRSMHHYAASSPTFEAFNLTLQERTSGTMGTFCTRCHMPLGTDLGENGLRFNVHRSQLSMEGVTCVVCHRRKQPTYKSNSRFYVQPGDVLTTCMYGPFDDAVSLHPAEGKPFIKTSAFCGTCHDVTSPNGLRLEEAFSEWQNSPAAKHGQTCQSCHMGPIAGVPIADCNRPLGRAAIVPGLAPEKLPLRHLSDHTFAGPDYSLLPDTEFPHKLDWMYETDYRNFEKLTPYQQKTLTDLRRRNRKSLELADLKRYELLRNAACIKVSAPHRARPGERVTIRVDVTSKTAGHSFPTGFTAERQAWVQVTVLDPSGRPVFLSGDLDNNADLRDEHSHLVESDKLKADKHLLNFQNKFTALTAFGTDRTVALSVNRHLAPINILRPAPGVAASFGRPETFRIAKGSLPPLATVGQTYPIHLPDMPGNYSVDVRLNFRHLPPVLLDHIGTPHLKHLLEIVVIDQHRSVIQVTNCMD